MLFMDEIVDTGIFSRIYELFTTRRKVIVLGDEQTILGVE